MSDAPSFPNRVPQRVVDYWAESRRPLVSMVFVAPLLLAYEIGVLVLGPHAVRNGVDVWLRQLLDQIDFGQYFLLPVLTVCILLACHHASHEPWRFRGATLSGMAVECALLAVCLRLLLQLQNGLVHPGTVVITPPGQLPAATSGVSGTLGGFVGFLGAGVYEELLFRLLLLPPAIWIVHRLGVPRAVSAVIAMVLVSLVFAGAHYIGPYGDRMDWFGFFFRFLAGVFFSVLFVYRGFGIAAGTHAAYDILVGLL
jgi:hypothetical protein